jgi:hypothetical protein
MDQTPEPSGPPPERPLPPLPDAAAVVFPVTDRQRQAALDHLDAELAGGRLDAAQVQSRRLAVLRSTSVAELLAATALEPAPAPGPVRPATRTNVAALLAGLVVGLLLLVAVVPRLL